MERFCWTVAVNFTVRGSEKVQWRRRFVRTMQRRRRSPITQRRESEREWKHREIIYILLLLPHVSPLCVIWALLCKKCPFPHFSAFCFFLSYCTLKLPPHPLPPSPIFQHLWVVLAALMEEVAVVLAYFSRSKSSLPQRSTQPNQRETIQPQSQEEKEVDSN